MQPKSTALITSSVARLIYKNKQANLKNKPKHRK